MPPKGWRKNIEGQYPQPSKEQDFMSIDEILFPRATVQKLAKNIINSSSDENSSNMIMAKDSMLALQRSSTVFVSNLMFQARQISKDQGRKTVNAQDILNALETAEFSGFVPEVKQKLSAFENNVALKKKQKLEKKPIKSEENKSPLSKRLKDNDEQTVEKTSDGDNDDDLEDGDEDEDATNETINDDYTTNNASNMVEEDEDENEPVEENPIAILSKEEEELTGVPDVEDVPTQNERESSDDEE